MAALLAGLPVEVPGQTVNRLCGSGLQAVASAAQAIRSGEGGADARRRRREHDPGSLRHAQAGQGRGTGLPPPWPTPRSAGGSSIPAFPPTGRSPWARLRSGSRSCVRISRQAQDEFARGEPAPGAGGARDGHVRRRDRAAGGEARRADREVTRDEPPRADVTAGGAGPPAPAFQPDGTVTAGSSSGINDGAAALAVVGRPVMEELGLQPLARRLSTAVAGVDPELHGSRPGPGDTQGARAGGAHGGSARPDRAQRGVRGPGSRLHPPAPTSIRPR